MIGGKQLNAEKRRERRLKIIALFVVFLFFSSILLSGYDMFVGG